MEKPAVKFGFWICANTANKNRFAPSREYPTHRKKRDEWGTPQLWQFGMAILISHRRQIDLHR